jgi:hypothetical protein
MVSTVFAVRALLALAVAEISSVAYVLAEAE